MSDAPADLSQYATHFNELSTEDHDLIVDLNAINPLSTLREDWQNATSQKSEHKISTAANTDDHAYIHTEERGQYTAGFMCQAGLGVRVPATPTGDSEMRWGYFETDSNDNPYNGFYFGADKDGIFVARASSGSIEKVYQDSWNRDKLTSDAQLNPSGRTLDISDGLVFRIDFTYYGYGPIEMKILMDDDDSDNFGSSDLVTAHTFHVKGQTSTDNTNLPLKVQIDSGGTSNDALDLYLGGRQFSIVGKQSSNNRLSGHYRDELTGVDDTQWYAAISFKIKDGSSNLGSGIDFTHVLGVVQKFSADADSNAYRWQIRKGTSPSNPSWGTPSTHVDTPDETAFKVDTNSADIQDGNGDLTGVFIDGGTIDEGDKNVAELDETKVEGQITNGQVLTLIFQAVPGSSGTISEIFLKMAEKW
jgi:hypothetical protein